MSVKISIAMPAGTHYAKYTIEVPLEAFCFTVPPAQPAQLHEEITTFASRTISAIHKETTSNKGCNEAKDAMKRSMFQRR